MNRALLKTYLKLCTEFYDLENHVHDAQAVAFYTDLALRIGGAILEPMCGSGRFLIPLRAGGAVSSFRTRRNTGFASIKKYPAFDCTKSIGQTTPIIIYECVN